jgi:hypothetical protein
MFTGPSFWVFNGGTGTNCTFTGGSATATPGASCVFHWLLFQPN